MSRQGQSKAEGQTRAKELAKSELQTDSLISDSPSSSPPIPPSPTPLLPQSLSPRLLIVLLLLGVGLLVGRLGQAQQTAPPAQATQLDPKAWGKNHAGEPVPEFVTSGECLFCHRNDVGTTWQKNAHGQTVRQREDAPQFKDIILGQSKLAAVGKEVEYFLGSRHHLRFLKKNGYGKFAILNTQAALDGNSKITTWMEAEKPAWDKEKFTNRCAGCHTTGVEPKEQTFATFSHDCYVCHGAVDLGHTNDTSLVWLSKKRKSDVLAVTSICASCHLREGKSKLSGLPFANNFVAGDNLFQDFQVDFSKADDESLNPGDRHVYRNVRDVVVNGKQTTCLNCHSVHGNSSSKHRLTPKTPICSDCHDTEKSIYKPAKQYTVKSALCEY
jgi:predicted CXXCH cytochrome family protein